MPAPSLSALRDVESQFDALHASILNFFSLPPYTLQLAGHNTSDVLITPRLEYEFALNEPAGPDGSNLLRPETGAQTAFAGTFTFRHIYDHTKTSAATAAAVRGALRTLLSPETAAITPGNLPWLEINALTEVSAVRSRFTQEDGKKLTEWFSTWEVVWMIRSSAWPI